MSENTDIAPATEGFEAKHLRAYIESGGKDGHYIDLSQIGGKSETPTLVLKTIGRHSGKPRLVPLAYGKLDGGFIIVGSKLGADVHPAWYLNLIELPEAEFQVGEACFRGYWRELDGEDRTRAWKRMVEDVYPPYADYQKGTTRRIPLIWLEPLARIDRFAAGEAAHSPHAWRDGPRSDPA